MCVCVLCLTGCWIISAIENHSRFHSLIMTVFAHDRARGGGQDQCYYHRRGGMAGVMHKYIRGT